MSTSLTEVIHGMSEFLLSRSASYRRIFRDELDRALASGTISRAQHEEGCAYIRKFEAED